MHLVELGPCANPLITAGIISEDLAEIFTQADEKIPVGRKQALGAKSTARIMHDQTGADVIEDLENQQREIDTRNARKEATAQRNVRRGGRGNPECITWQVQPPGLT